MLNGRLMLALARQDPEPIVEALRDTPRLPVGAQWATFLRNHDEIDLSRLTAEQRAEVFDQFGPEKRMRLYDRGIRRRLAPMLGGDRRRLELAYSLQFTLRGTPVLRYGAEIGMGDDLSLEGRDAIRTPMQWSPSANGGFTAAERPVRPVVSDGRYGYQTVNVTDQRHDPGSLLAWFERMIRTLRESPEIGNGDCTHVDRKMPPGVLAHRADGRTGSMLFLHNLGTRDACLDLSDLYADAQDPNEVFGDQPYEPVGRLDALDLAGYGYRWIRLRRNPRG
jgi:maltose alpha-D-glucosyltransferase/alpha-amylase